MYLFLNYIQGASRPEFRESREVDRSAAESLLVALLAFIHRQYDFGRQSHVSNLQYAGSLCYDGPAGHREEEAGTFFVVLLLPLLGFTRGEKQT